MTMAVDRLNSLGLPEKYQYIKSNENESLIGLIYQGAKKEEVIVEPKYTQCTAFKALGKIWIAYFNEDDYYVIRNKKGDIETSVPVYDFVACNKALYCKIKTNRGFELAQMNKELDVVKTFGILEFADYYTNHGNRVIPNTRQTLDVKDRSGRLCRINMTDNTLEDVISFGSDARVNINKEVEEDNIVEEWRYDVDITKGTITKSDGLGGHVSSIANLRDLGEDKVILISLFGQAPEEKTEEVKVKRHMETRTTYVFDGIDTERAEKIDKIVRSIPGDGKLSNLRSVFIYFDNNLDGIAKFFTEGFKTFYKKDIAEYGIKILTTNDKMITVVRSASGKVTMLQDDIDTDYVMPDSLYEVVSYETTDKDLTHDEGKIIPKPSKYKNKNNSFYKRGISAKCEMKNTENDDDLIEVKFMLFDRFTFGPLAVEASHVEVDGHRNRYNYNDQNIVLTTTTSDIYIILE